MNTYQLAFALESGKFDIVETFEASSEAAANEYAEAEFPGAEWYVLNAKGQNING